MTVGEARLVRRLMWVALGIALLSAAALYGLSGLRERQAASAQSLPALAGGATGRLEVLGSVAAFELRAHTGEWVSPEFLRDSVWVVDFFFSSCRGVCPSMKANLQVVQAAFAERPGLKIVSITVDPETDTLEHLRGFAEQLGARPGQWFFLTGEQSAIYRLSREGFSLGASEVPEGFVHSDRFILIDRRGRVRGYYRGTETESVSDLIQDARTLLDEGG